MKHEKFITQYCRLIDQCHGQRPDKFWFSTWMSSKSPYFHFPQNFEKFWLMGLLPTKNNFFQKIILVFRQMLTLVSVLIKSFYLKVTLRRELKSLLALQGQEINLLRTFLYKSDPLAKDPFWGELVEFLAHNRRSLVTIYDPNFSILYCKKAYCADRRNFPYLVFLSPFSIIKTYFLLIREAFTSISFEGNFTVNDIDIKSFLIDSYQGELLTPSSLVNLVFMNSFENIFKKFKIHKAYLTFENNPWEKMFYLARCAANKNIEVIGFQHSSIQEGATNYYLSTYESVNHLCPDKIFSVGQYTYELMKSLPHYKNIPIQIGCALRHSYLDKLDESPIKLENDNMRLLVILDGTIDTFKLIDLVMGFIELNKLNNLVIIIKDHPNLLIKNFLPKFLGHKNIVNKKISISNAGLQQNLEWADIILYTGTTSSIEALKMGKGVINFNFSLFNYDPLFQFSDFKWEVSTPQDLCNIVGHYIELSPEKLLQKKIAAKNFVNSYFSPCTKENIERFL